MRPWEVKLMRAEEHLDVLRSEIQDYLYGGMASVVSEQQAEPNTYHLRLRLKQLPPPRWSALLGDFLHNTRSSLDCLIFALLVERSPRPLTTRQERLAQLPITQDEA